ncbi:hypothetical protein CONLIGDRAFT_671086 [Coniochaeta ligniaria NRRL 30616]|uniref:Uncharacterized protein n=1 Tax=Coniochaeta ligniaria NRRL 30616 TaxID=1408157 RepID=A0A1J7IIH0_9PEZI|nr:hypothetical protein CONLIGDRAFT_671086 [Coniochaeta ligniaria NRRL 30616]
MNASDQALDLNQKLTSEKNMETFDRDYFSIRRHNSMSIWQKSAQDSSVADGKPIIADLFEATSRLLISVSRYLTTSGLEYELESGNSTGHSLGERMKSETERFYLWGFDMSVGNGLLDAAVSRKDEVREAIVATLYDLGYLLLIAARQETLQYCSSCRLARDQLEHVLDCVGCEYSHLGDLSSHDEEESEEDDSYDLNDLPDQVETYIICLLDISMAMGDLFGDSVHPSLDTGHESDAFDTEHLPTGKDTSGGGFESKRNVEGASEQLLPVSPSTTIARLSQQQRAATWHTSQDQSEVHIESDDLRARQYIALRIAEMRESLNNTDNDRLAGAWKARGDRYVNRTATRQAGISHPMMAGSHNVPVEYHATQSSSTHWMIRMLRRPSKLTIPLSIAVGAARQRRVVRVQ